MDWGRKVILFGSNVQHSVKEEMAPWIKSSRSKETLGSGRKVNSYFGCKGAGARTSAIYLQAVPGGLRGAGHLGNCYLHPGVSLGSPVENKGFLSLLLEAL